MKTPSIAIRWAKALKDFNPELESMRSFGKRNNLNVCQISHWYKRFQEEPKLKEIFAEISKNPQKYDDNKKQSSHSKVECIEIVHPPVFENIIIERKDWKIHLPGNFSSENLKKIVGILGEV